MGESTLLGMRRCCFIIGLGALLTVSLCAQHRGVRSRGGSDFASRSVSARAGFGNILFPGTGGPPPRQSQPTFAQRYGANIRGQILPRTYNQPRGPVVRTPAIAYPVYYGGFGYGYSAPAPPQPVHVTVQQPPVSQPPVIINQYYNAPAPEPVVREYSEGELPETASKLRTFHAPTGKGIAPKPAVTNAEDASDEPTIYLIAYKDQSIYPALGYWIEEDTLHYITRMGNHNRASLDLIDREFSEQLNHERGLDFELKIE